jgi:hypothetical protein
MEQIDKQALDLHRTYYRNYGLALRGLVYNNHGVGKYVPYSCGDVDCDGFRRSIRFR